MREKALEVAIEAAKEAGKLLRAGLHAEKGGALQEPPARSSHPVRSPSGGSNPGPD